VTQEFVKPGATVIDVGITSLRDRETVERLFTAGSKRRDVFERRGSVSSATCPSVEQVAGALVRSRAVWGR
jgi:5,10-methylene-tetrahydrofolate dehydrogenase/methenyl tetrahydrofolate cyclohydrolase